MNFITLEPEQFRKFASKYPDKSFYQTPEIANLRAENGWTPYYFGVEENGKIKAASLVVAKPTFLGKSIYYVPGGPLIDYEDESLTTFFFKNLKNYAKSHNGYILHIEPYYEKIERDRDGEPKEKGFNREKASQNLRKLGFTPLAQSDEPKYSFALELKDQTADKIFADMKRNTRNHIRKAEKMGVKIRELKREELNIFKQITESTSARRNFTDKPLSYYEKMYDLFHPRGEVKFIMAGVSEDALSRSIIADGAITERPSPVTTGARERSEKDVFSPNPLDIWITSRLYQLRDEITTGMEEYNLPKALEGVLPFIDDMSNWFVRRSRRRFSKNDNENDKKQAFETLYYVLLYLSKLLAPFTPFLAEELYQKMTGNTDSVHLLGWPEVDIIDTEVLENMSRTRQIITDSLALRMQKSETEDQIKIRQPLSKLTYDGDKLDNFYEKIILEEVNVKSVVNGKKLSLDKTLTPELLEEGRAREIIRAVQAARKHAKLSVDDQIKLFLSCDLPKGYEELIKTETGTKEITNDDGCTHNETTKLGSENITISLEKI